MSKVLDFLAVDKEQELLQSFIRLGAQADEDGYDDYSTTNRKGSRRRITSAKRGDGRRKSVKFIDNGSGADDKQSGAAGGTRSNRIENELKAARKKTEEQLQKKKKVKENFVDFYTDKDRAAAVSAGAYDIKQSLQIKQKQDRNEALLIPEEADISSIIALGLKEIKNANPENAMHFFSKIFRALGPYYVTLFASHSQISWMHIIWNAMRIVLQNKAPGDFTYKSALELNPIDINALVSRSKCYLLLGESSKALQDAESALAEEKNNIRAIYQKAESLYYLGQFEQSLMYFHRGLLARPELSSFRLGIQKTQEAIENTIGVKNKPSIAAAKVNKAKKSGDNTPKSQVTSSRLQQRAKPSKAELERRNARKLLGELCVDKEYLENLLKHPDLVRADTNMENISSFAQEAVDFLNKRKEFWRQQRQCTALSNHKSLPVDAMPRWF